MSTQTYATTVIGEADYKGRRYAVLHRTRATFEGVQRDRTKLAFTDLSKEFWVDTQELRKCEKFPSPVDAEDYLQHPASSENRSADVEAELNDPEPREISYCAHCGQRLP